MAIIDTVIKLLPLKIGIPLVAVLALVVGAGYALKLIETLLEGFVYSIVALVLLTILAQVLFHTV